MKIFLPLNKMKDNEKYNRKDILLTNLPNVHFICDVFQTHHTLKCQSRIELGIKSLLQNQIQSFYIKTEIAFEHITFSKCNHK